MQGAGAGLNELTVLGTFVSAGLRRISFVGLFGGMLDLLTMILSFRGESEGRGGINKLRLSRERIKNMRNSRGRE
jgi:hypothetical protein